MQLAIASYASVYALIDNFVSDKRTGVKIIFFRRFNQSEFIDHPRQRQLYWFFPLFGIVVKAGITEVDGDSSWDNSRTVLCNRGSHLLPLRYPH